MSDLSFGEALRLNNDDDYAAWVKRDRQRWKDRMIAEAMVYFPTIDRWFPEGTEIAGIKSGEYIP